MAEEPLCDDTLNCYCCTCDIGWDPACRNHGAHGVRPCERHGNGSLEDLICGCGCEES